MEKEKPDVILVTQSYPDFAYGSLEEKLEFVGMVTEFCDLGPNFVLPEKLMLDIKVEEAAKKLGASYVFSVRYQFSSGKYSTYGFVYGDAYKVVDEKKTPFRD